MSLLLLVSFRAADSSFDYVSGNIDSNMSGYPGGAGQYDDGYGQGGYSHQGGHGGGGGGGELYYQDDQYYDQGHDQRGGHDGYYDESYVATPPGW